MPEFWTGKFPEWRGSSRRVKKLRILSGLTTTSFVVFLAGVLVWIWEIFSFPIGFKITMTGLILFSVFLAGFVICMDAIKRHEPFNAFWEERDA